MPTFLGVPPGAIREVANFIYKRAPYPNETIALVGATSLIAALCQRSHNINGTGLNQYLLMVAPTGTGKEQAPDGIARLLVELERSHPHIADVRGPGEIVSAPGLHRALANRNNPSMLCIIGEAGLMLSQLASPKRDPNKVGVERMVLHLYSKSGYGNVLDDAAYADSQKNYGIVYSPALTILGDTTGETFYGGAIDERTVQSGLFPRFAVFETIAPRPYYNQHRIFDPCPQLVEQLRRICAASLDLQASKQVCNVAMSPDAAEWFLKFENWTTDRVNGSLNETERNLWTRVNMKALKLAATNAVGVNPLAPRITYDECMWATNLIVDQTTALIGKFNSGEVGEVSGNELLQQDRVLTVMRECIERPFEQVKSQYGGTIEMHRSGLVTHQYLQRRLLSLPLFKGEGPGKATPALKRALQSLGENAKIGHLSPMKANKLFGHAFLCYSFAQYDKDNEVEKAKSAVFFAPDIGETVRENMK